MQKRKENRQCSVIKPKIYFALESFSVILIIYMVSRFFQQNIPVELFAFAILMVVPFLRYKKVLNRPCKEVKA